MHSSSGQEAVPEGNHVDVNDPIYQVLHMSETNGKTILFLCCPLYLWLDCSQDSAAHNVCALDCNFQTCTPGAISCRAIL